MAIEIVLPELGDGIDAGDILDILVSEGDLVAQDQGVVEVETDKATVEVPSPAAGRVAKLHVQVGTNVKVGGLIATLDNAPATTGQSTSATPPSPSAQPSPSAPSAPPLPEPETNTPPPSTPAAEIPSEPVPSITDEAKSDAPVTGPAAAGQIQASSEPVEKLPPAGKAVAAGPAIRRLAREVGVDLASVTGTGPGGRISREDILKVVRSTHQNVRGTGDTSPERALPGNPSRDQYGPVSIESASKIRRTIAKNMHASWSTVPRVTNFDDADVTELEKIRQSSKQDYAAKGIKLTSMPFVIKSVAMALRHHPSMNATYDQAAGEIIYKNYVNVGVAVDTDRGLVVPVLRDADDLSIAETAKRLAAAAEKVRTGSFEMKDIQGGTFTISNLGAIGGTYSTPIVNVPEVAILLIGRSRPLPVVVDDEIAVRLMMPLSLSYDHRLVDGATAARFLNDVIDYLEAPGRLLLAP